MDQIVLENVTKTFTTKALGTVTAVDRFNLKVKEGECFSFLGPSGCGKTTTLRMIAGFEDLSSGSIYLGGKAVSVKEKYLRPAGGPGAGDGVPGFRGLAPHEHFRQRGLSAEGAEAA